MPEIYLRAFPKSEPTKILLYLSLFELGLSQHSSVSTDTCHGTEKQVLAFFFFYCLFIWLQWVSVVALGIFSCAMRDLVPQAGMEPGPPALGARSLSHWTTREVPAIPSDISNETSGEGNGCPLQYSCLKNFIDRRAWQATVHGVAKSQTRLSD